MPTTSRSPILRVVAAHDRCVSLPLRKLTRVLSLFRFWCQLWCQRRVSQGNGGDARTRRISKLLFSLAPSLGSSPVRSAIISLILLNITRASASLVANSMAGVRAAPRREGCSRFADPFNPTGYRAWGSCERSLGNIVPVLPRSTIANVRSRASIAPAGPAELLGVIDGWLGISAEEELPSAIRMVSA
jgi:hypothetical protein